MKVAWRSVLLISALVIIWGISWPIYKYSLAYTPPILFAGMRTFGGGLLMAIILWPSRHRIRFRQHAKLYLACAAYNVILFFGLQTIGLTYLPGGLFTVIVYLQPVLVGILAWLMLGETMNVSKLAGLLLGFIGVGVVSVDGLLHTNGLDLDRAWIGIVLALATAFSWAWGAIYVKRRSADGADTLWLVSIQSMLGGIFMLTFGSAVESWGAIQWSWPVYGGLIFAATLGVSTAWVIYYKLVQQGEASKVAASTFLVPLIAVSGSSLLLGEGLSLYLLLGLLFIMGSIFLVNRKAKTVDESTS